MNKLILTLALAATSSMTAVAQEKFTIKTHDKDLITTSVNSYAKWAKFPSADSKIRKIVMKVTMGTPVQDTMRCADWDYSDPIYLRQVGGANGPKVNYEIGRMLTPYGGANAKGWEFQWEADVTDFAGLLRDSVLLDFTHGGGEAGHDRGWALSMEFEITPGEPILEPIKVHEIHNRVYPYGQPTNSIENYLTENKITASPETNIIRSRIIQTGHGMDAPDNCAEFCSKWRDVIWDGRQATRTQLWKRCGDNPLYPQAGTWLYNRANWCPGYLVQPETKDFTVKPGSSHTYELNMEPYTSQGVANQQISAYLIEYKAGRNTRDVAIEDVVAPSRKGLWSRFNPTVSRPVIIVRNNTARKVTSLDLKYGTQGMQNFSEQWKGIIEPYGTARIELSNPLQSQSSKEGLFEVSVEKVNGGNDQYTADNAMSSAFDPVPMHKGDVVFVFEPNNSSTADNSYYIADSKGVKIVERKLGSIDSTRIYRDTLSLTDGDYQLRVEDVTGNGLEFWGDSRGTNGRCYMLNHKGEVIKFFDPDFGDNIRYDFRVDHSLATETLDHTPAFWLDRTSTSGPFTINLLLNNKSDKIRVSIVDYDSKPKSSVTMLPPADGVLEMDVTGYATGRHFVIVEQNGNKYLRRVQHVMPRRPRR